MPKKHLHGVETMSRFQVARGQSSKEGDASCPVPSEYITFLLLRGALLRPSPAHLPRCVPGSHNIVKAVILLSNVALCKHQIPRLPLHPTPTPQVYSSPEALSSGEKMAVTPTDVELWEVEMKMTVCRRTRASRQIFSRPLHSLGVAAEVTEAPPG